MLGVLYGRRAVWPSAIDDGELYVTALEDAARDLRVFSARRPGRDYHQRARPPAEAERCYVQTTAIGFHAGRARAVPGTLRWARWKPWGRTAPCSLQHRPRCLLHYLMDTQMTDPHIAACVQAPGDAMLDANTRRNLELTQGLRSQNAWGSLLWLLDRTATAMGGRLLRSWVEQPLLDIDRIRERLDAVRALWEEPVLCEALLEKLNQVYDMERLLSRVAYKTVNARDCLSLLRSLRQAPDTLSLLDAVDAPGIRAAAALLPVV